MRRLIIAPALLLLVLALTGCSKRKLKQAPPPPDLALGAPPSRASTSGARRAAASAHFICPHCGKATLAVGRTLRFRPDGYSDDLALQSIACSGCDKRGVATYEESRRGRGDRFHHRGGWLSRDDHAAFHKLIDRCPNPDNKRCSCEAHERYYQLERHSWKGLKMFSIVGEIFTMRLK